jgi:hypothetical protein
MNPTDLVCLLSELPESRLRLTELAWEAVGEDGSLDPAKVAFYAKELTEAIHEAGAYSQATKEMVLCLRELVRSQS